MADSGTRFADEQHKEIERRIRSIYEAATKDIIERLNAHSKAMYAKDAIMRQKVEDGEITQKRYKEWLAGQLFVEKNWKDQISEATNVLLTANEQANAIVEGARRAVFTENANWQEYKIEQDLRGAISFTLYDSATVTRLLRDQPNLLPPRKVDGERDKAWNREKISSVIARGVISGDSIPKIARNIGKETGSSNEKAMLRYARTAMTGAQNAGRLETMRDARDMGIKVKKLWIATLDDRTRDAHAELDGHTAEIDEPFDSILGPIMFPGDPGADDANTWNCRCALGYEYPEYASGHAERYDQYAGEVIDDITYEEWLETKHPDWKEPETTALNRGQVKILEHPERVEFGELFDKEKSAEAVEKIDKQVRELYRIDDQLGFVGDVRVSRNLPLDIDVFDLHHEYKELVSAEAQYLAYGNKISNGKPIIEIHNENLSDVELKQMFNGLYNVRNNEGASALFSATVGMEGTLLHEYGHFVGDYYGVFGEQRWNGKAADDFKNYLVDYWKTHDTSVISQYAAVNPFEFFAEAFAQSFDTEHPDLQATRMANEIMDKFHEYIGFNPGR